MDERGVPDEDTTRLLVRVWREQVLVQALEPRRGVDRVTDHEVFRPLGAAERAADHGPGEDSDAHAGRRQTLSTPSAIELAERFPHGQGTIHRVDRVLRDLLLGLPRGRYPECDHDGITGILPDHALV